eukprot:jgi/Bigna1/84619/fgenesh1_pg.175_\
MVPLSEAPEEKLTERQMKYQQRKEEAKAPKAKGFLGHESDGEVRQHFKQLAQLMDTNSNPWDAQGEDQVMIHRRTPTGQIDVDDLLSSFYRCPRVAVDHRYRVRTRAAKARRQIVAVIASTRRRGVLYL